MLWMHNLKNIFYDDHFVPDGAPSDESYKGEEIIYRNVVYAEICSHYVWCWGAMVRGICRRKR
jgi:hypothetical protein